MSVGIVYDPIFLKHDTGEHIENRNRLVSVISHLKQTRIMNQLVPILSRPASSNELSSIHHKQHISTIQTISQSGGGEVDSDTVISTDSFDAAVCAAGGTIEATEAVLQSRVDNAFALVRPPGHHATANIAMGFCLFNNIAIAANYVLAKHRLDRVAIIDFDVHHGNGTQSVFYSDPRVLYVSVHQHPLFPGTGNIAEIGIGQALGTKVNIPLPPGCGDSEYRMTFEQVVIPAVKRFGPQYIFVSAGYDAHWADEISAMELSIQGFIDIIKIIRNLAAETCHNRITLVLEGGYNLKSLAASVNATFEVLLGKVDISDPLGLSPFHKPAPDISDLLNTICDLHNLK